ncbi:hypothetical protein C8R44DRAFT_783665 [Mycena epipterygia]|nr:hypothetical protein C8R44DRAFT_783665 [Mycena epipterygia]
MSTLSFLDLFFILHLMMTSIRLCAAAHAVLHSHETNNTIPSRLSGNSSSAHSTLAESSVEKRGSEGHRVDQIIVASLLVALILFFIFNLALVVTKQTSTSLRLWCRRNIRPAFTNLAACLSRTFRSPVPHTAGGNISSYIMPALSHIVAVSLRYTIRYTRRNGLQAPIIPLHHIGREPQSPPERTPSPVPPPPVLFHDHHEPHRQLSRPSMSDANGSQFSLAMSEAWSAGSDTPTVVQELAPRRGFF